MENRQSKSPPVARWLLKKLKGYREDHGMLGDMEEIYLSMRRTGGTFRGKTWYWKQTFCAVFLYAKNAVKWGMMMFANYLKIACRNVMKNKAYSMINIAGLAVGLAAFLLIFLYIKYENSFDGFHQNNHLIYRIVTDMHGHTHSGKDKMAISPFAAGPAFVREFPEIESANRVVRMGNGKISLDKRSFYEKNLLFADKNFFAFFSFPLADGEAAEVLSDPNSVVISEQIRDKYFLNGDAIGRVIRLNDETDLKVTGIMKNMPENTQFKSDFLISLETYGTIYKRDLTSWKGRCYTFIRMIPGSDFETVEKKVIASSEKHMPKQGNIHNTLYLQPLSDIHLQSFFNGEMAATTDNRTLYIFGSIAILILLLACINHMNLTTARSTVRFKEVRVRKVVGAKRSHLIRQFFTESVIFIFLAYLVSIFITGMVLSGFNRSLGLTLGIPDLFDRSMILLMGVTLLFSAFLAGIYPALFLSRLKPLVILRSGSMMLSKPSGIRGGLVVFQFAITIILMVCTLMINRQLHFIRDYRVGYTKDQIVVFTLNDARVREKLPLIKSDLSGHSRIKQVVSSSHLPNNILDSTIFRWSGKPEDLELRTYSASVDYDFVSLYDLEIVKGRNFSKQFSTDTGGAFLINESAMGILNWDHVIGHELIHWNGEKGQVVGVLKDFHFHSLHRSVEPLYLYLDPIRRNYHLSLKIDKEGISETVSYILSYLKQYPSNFPIEYRFFDDIFDSAYKSEMQVGKLFSVFAALAMMIAGLGLVGLASFMVTRRTREIGIRKVLGSTEIQLIWQFLKSFLKWILLANVLSWPISLLLMHRWLQDFAYRAAMSVDLFLLAGIFSILIAVILILQQVLRAVKTNPVETLKYE